MKTSRIFRTAFLTFSVSLAMQDAAAATLLEIYQQAVENDHEYQAARADLEAGLQSRAIGRSALLPQITAEATWARSDRDDTSSSGEIDEDVVVPVPTNPTDGDLGPTMLANGDFESTSKTVSVGVNQPLLDFGAWHRFEQGRSLAHEAEAIFLNEAQDLVLRTTNAYFNVLLAADTLATAQAEAEALRQQLEQSRQRFEVGLTAITEVHEAQAAFDSANANRLQAQGNLGVAFEALEVLTGQSYREISPLQEKLAVTPPEPANREHWEKLALENNALLKAAQFRAEAAEATADIARAEHYPTIRAGLQRGKSDIERTYGDVSIPFDDATTTTVSVTLSVPLFSGGGISASRKQAYNQYLSARELYLGARRNTTQATRVSYLDVVTSAATVQAREQAIVSARSALEATQAGYEVGTRDLVDVLNAQRNLFSAQRDFYDSLYSYIIARLELSQAAGVLTEEDIVQLNAWLDTSRSVTLTVQ